MYYLNSRYYNAEIGRFISSDAYFGDLNNVHSFNLYAYVNNNPISFTDPSGYMGLALVSGFAIFAKIAAALTPAIPVLIFVVAVLIVVAIIYHIIEEAVDNSSHVRNKDTGELEKGDLPKEGESNSVDHEFKGDGSLKKTRWYGEDGKAIHDRDYDHNGPNHDFPHDHIWDWSKKSPRGKFVDPDYNGFPDVPNPLGK